MNNRLVAAAVATVVMTLGVSACTNGVVKALPPPPEVKQLPTTTTLPDYSGTSIPPVKGTTTLPPVKLMGGSANIAGKITVDGSPAGGVTVRVDRFVGDASATADATTAADGTFRFSGVLGGRYRMRAFRAPDATLNSPVTFYVADGQTQTQNLALSKFSTDQRVGANIAPNPPLLGDVANVAVQITTQGVDGNGTAKSIGQSGVQILLLTGSGQSITTANPTTTNGNGTAIWTIRCDSLGSQGLTAVLPDGTQKNLGLPGCQLPPTTTSTSSTSTTLEP